MKIIQVKQEHIDAANIARKTIDNLSSCCPITQAAKDVFDCPVLTGRYFLRVLGEDKIKKYSELPAEAVEFMDNWDNKKKVKPFQFNLS